MHAAVCLAGAYLYNRMPLCKSRTHVCTILSTQPSGEAAVAKSMRFSVVELGICAGPTGMVLEWDSAGGKNGCYCERRGL